MAHGDRAPMEDALGEYWNTLVADPPGSPSSSTDLDPSLVATIQRLRLLDDGRAPDPKFVQDLERVLMNASATRSRLDSARSRPGLLDFPNGHGQTNPGEVNAHPGAAPIGPPHRLVRPVAAANRLLAAAVLLLMIVASMLAAGVFRVGIEDRGGVPAVLPAMPEIPVEFVWESRGGSELPQVQRSSGLLLPLTDPYHLAIDPHGNLWIPDTWNNSFRILAPDGAFRQMWGSKGRGEGEFNFLNVEAFNEHGFGAAAFDAAGNLYVADPGNFRIQKFAPDLSFLTTWGSKGEGEGQFLALNDLAIDSEGRVYALDKLRSDVQVFDADGEFLASWGGYGTNPGEFLTPYGLAIDGDDNVVIADTGNHRLQKISPDGTFLASWGEMGTDPAMFRQPDDVAIDQDGRIFVTDTSNNRVQILDAQGQFLAAWGERGAAPGQFVTPTGIAFDQAGNVYITEAGDGNERVQKFRLLAPFTP